MKGNARERKPQSLICCCCGSNTYGRQWFNRDKGFGLCNKCAYYLMKQDTPEVMVSNYGHRGIHYLLTE